MSRPYLIMPIWAVMQSWGDLILAGDDKNTLPFPTHSGLCGLICAALGIDRKDYSRLSEIHNSLDFIVLELCQGKIESDFYSVSGVLRAGTLKADPNATFIGRKNYLSDSAFIVAAYEKETLKNFSLDQIGEKLFCPVFPVYAGRKSYPFLVPPVVQQKGKPLVHTCDDPLNFLSLLKQDLVREQKKDKAEAFQGDFTLPQMSKLPKIETGKKDQFYLSESFLNLPENADKFPELTSTIPYKVWDYYQPEPGKIRRFCQRKVYSSNNEFKKEEEHALS